MRIGEPASPLPRWPHTMAEAYASKQPERSLLTNPAIIHDLLTTVTRHLDHRPGPIRMGGASAGGGFDAVNPLRVSAGSFTTYASFR